MDRKGIIAVALAIAALVWWQIDNSKRMAAVQREREQAAELAKLNAPEPAPGAPAIPGNPAAPGTPAVPSAPTQPTAPEQLDTAGSEAVDFSFTNLGGGIRRAVLKKHQAEHGSNVVVNQFGGHAIGAISDRAVEEAGIPFTREEGAKAGEVSYLRTDARQVQIRKRFTLPQAGATDEYVTQLELTFTNQGQQPVQYPSFYVYTGSAAPIHQLDQPQYSGFGWMPGGRFIFKNVGAFMEGGMLGFGKKAAPVFQEDRPDTAWAGVTNQYFSSIVTPLDTKGGGAWARRFEVSKALIGTAGEPGATMPTPTNEKAQADPGLAEVVEGAIAMPAFTMAPGQTVTQKFQLYTGPREYQRLKALGHGEDEMMEFGMFKAVSKVLLNSLNWLHSKFGSYAAAIIVLTIIIRGLMWPIQNKATQSMKKMQALQPLMTDLKAKYKDDPGRMNQELMKLYKDYQINPLAGCLPMVVQIPVFFGFFSMLGKAVELRHAKFLWIHDLSQMDTVAMLPIIGQPLNVLPLLMAATMLWQMSLSPKSGDPVQQRVFMFMPLIFIFFCYKYASALALYWTVQNLFSVGQLYVTRNQTAPTLQKVIPPPKKR